MSHIIESPITRTEPFTFVQYKELRQKLWLLEDKRIFFIVCLPVETGATPMEISNIMKDAIKIHKSKDGKTYSTVFVHEGSKRIIKKKSKKNDTITTQARARDIVFNSDMTSKIMDYMGYSSPSQYLIPKLKRSGSTEVIGKDLPFTRAGLLNIIKNSPIPIPINLHQVKNGKQGGRHLFKQFTRSALIHKGMWDENLIRIMMGHAPRDSDEKYANQVDIELGFTIVENTFVD